MTTFKCFQCKHDFGPSKTPVRGPDDEPYCTTCAAWAWRELYAQLAEEKQMTQWNAEEACRQIDRMKLERDGARDVLRCLFYDRTGCGQKIEDFVSDGTAQLVRRELGYDPVGNTSR